MTRLLILGASGHSKVVAELALETGQYSELAFLDDSCMGGPVSSHFLGYPLLGPLSLIYDPSIRSSFHHAIVAIGENSLRLKYFKELVFGGYETPSLIHPTAFVSRTSTIGLSVVVCAQACVQSEVMVGSCSILNTASSIDHNSYLNEAVHISPGARLAGDVTVGSCSWVGIGASVIQGVRIGSNVIVGAGSTVLRDVQDCLTVCGVPARTISTSK